MSDEIEFVNQGKGVIGVGRDAYRVAATLHLPHSNLRQGEDDVDTTSTTVDGLVSMWRRYGWEGGIRDGSMPVFIYGGEPLIEQHQESIVSLLKVLNPVYTVIETNATIIPSAKLDTLVDLYVAHPHLGTSDINSKYRVTEESMEWFAEKARKKDKVDFTFDMKQYKQNRNKDVEEVLGIVNSFGIPDRSVYLAASPREAEEVVKEDEEVEDRIRDSILYLANKHGYAINYWPEGLRDRGDRFFW